MAQFQPNGTMMPFGAPVLRNQIITNSVVITVNNSVKLASGFVALGTTGALVYGHVAGVATAKDVGVQTDGTAGAAIGSFLGAYTASSSNQTVAKAVAKIDVSKYTLYSAALDDVIGTTTGSNLAGYTMDLADSTQLDESTAVTTTGQYMSEGVDPASSSRVLVHIYESQFFGV